MKKLLVFILSLLLILTGCSRGENAQIAATTLPVYTFTTMLCEGTGITVTRLVTEDVSCLHDYTVQVSQMQAVEAAQVIVHNGAGLEEFLEDVLAHANGVIDASRDIDLHCSQEHDAHHHAHDPHIWLSPANAKQMSKNICTSLCELYPGFTELFEKNLTALLGKLDDLQNYGENALKDLSSRQLLTFHDGFSYFANSFGLEIVMAVEEESGSEASARELIELVGLVNANKLPAIFTEVNGSTAAAGIIAKETGCAVYQLDMAMSGNSYFDAMYRNIDTVKEALE